MNKNPDQSQLIEEIAKASNILVALNANPTIDELTSALGLTLMLNKNDRRAIAIFSGKIPEMISFLDVEKVFDTNTDGLRDFIVMLDAKKADRVITKAEDGMVKVYITPSGISIGSGDLEFSQGDYNIDLVIGVGVPSKDNFDKALAAHGRILHNAAVVSIGIGDKKSQLGSINLHDQAANSYAEVIARLPKELDKISDDPAADLSMDKAVATALLTGLITTTERFSNNKTTAEIMSLAADLMKAGGNQQLITSELIKFEQIESQKLAAARQAEIDVVEKNKVDQLAESQAKSTAETAAKAQQVNLRLDQISDNQQAPDNTINLKNINKSKNSEIVIPPLAPPVAPMVAAVPPSTPGLSPQAVTPFKLNRKKELVIEPPKGPEERIKPDFSNLESISQKKTSEKFQETANEVLRKLDQVKNTVTHKSDEQEAQLQAQIDKTTAVAAEPVDELSFEEAPIPATNFKNKTTETAPNPEIIFGKEVKEPADSIPKVIWGQKLDQADLKSTPNANSLKPAAVVAQDDIKPKLPVNNPAPAPVFVPTPAPAPAPAPAPKPQVARFIDPQPAPAPQVISGVELPPLPDFSQFGIAPPLPPMPPSFEFPLPPTSNPAQIASPIPTVNPFNQFADELKQSQPAAYVATPSVDNSSPSPIMADQVYPAAPSSLANKAEFVIPE